uniref:Uncharacterized protein n=1 Tax=viral metagenome TaxID=1070528 RepID=A0A6C0K073_9ZZZZ
MSLLTIFRKLKAMNYYYNEAPLWWKILYDDLGKWLLTEGKSYPSQQATKKIQTMKEHIRKNPLKNDVIHQWLQRSHRRLKQEPVIDLDQKLWLLSQYQQDATIRRNILDSIRPLVQALPVNDIRRLTFLLEEQK